MDLIVEHIERNAKTTAVGGVKTYVIETTNVNMIVAHSMDNINKSCNLSIAHKLYHAFHYIPDGTIIIPTRFRDKRT